MKLRNPALKLSVWGRRAAWTCAVAMAVVWWFTSIYMSVATFAYFCLILGLIERKAKSFHMRLMLAGILTDVITVLILEVTRSAVGTATSDPLSALQITHIACSFTAVVLYFPTAYLGFKRFKNSALPLWYRKCHICIGLTAFALRSIGWLTMFSFNNYGH